MELQNRLKDLREDEDKSQTEVANYLSIHQTTLSKYEKRNNRHSYINIM